MSLQARQTLVAALVCQSDSQRADLLDPARTRTELIALLVGLAQRFHLEITAVRSDHHDDSHLGLHCHALGYAVDLWPLRSGTPGDYMDAGEAAFQVFLQAVAGSPWLYQVGLAGSAAIPRNFVAAGPSSFQDDGADHIHLGAI